MLFNISYTRPYLPHPECDEVQRTQVIANTPKAVLDIYADCEVLSIEEVISEPQTVAESVSVLYGTSELDWQQAARAEAFEWQDWKATQEDAAR